MKLEYRFEASGEASRTNFVSPNVVLRPDLQELMVLKQFACSLQMTQQINECAEDLVNNLAQEADTGKAFEVKE